MAESLLDRFRVAQEALEERHGSQRKAARACGVSYQSWGQWRRGTVPRMDAVEKVLGEFLCGLKP